MKFTEPSGDKVDIIDSGKTGAAWLALSSLIFCSHYLVPTGFWVFLELKFFSTEKCRKPENHSMNWDILVECDAGLNSFHGALVTWMFLVCCNHCRARLGIIVYVHPTKPLAITGHQPPRMPSLQKPPALSHSKCCVKETGCPKEICFRCWQCLVPGNESEHSELSGHVLVHSGIMP